MPIVRLEGRCNFARTLAADQSLVVMRCRDVLLRGKTKDELEQEEEEYKAFLERQVGEDIGELIKFDEDEPSGSTSAAQKEEKKEKKKKGKGKSTKSKEEEDQEFLME